MTQSQDLNRKAIEGLGEDEEVTNALYGAAVKIHTMFGVDLGDVVQEIIIEAMSVKEKYGYVNVNTSVFHARNNLRRDAAYGVNAYYRDQGISELSIEAKNDADQNDADKWEPWSLERAEDVCNWDDVERRIAVEQELDRIEDDTDRAVLEGMAEGLTYREIAEEAGCHYTSITRKKNRLAERFESIL
jgi:DNA-directed RNA polymerase specialized sigma24 family protein